MFESLNSLPADPILGLMALFRNDNNPNKVDLGVGVYRDETGNTPVLACVKQAEQQLLGAQKSKVYVGPAGNVSFNQAMLALLLGQDNRPQAEGRTAILQTPGGCGALRVAAELIKSARPEASIWVSDPTWGNHIPLLGNAGITIHKYPYYNPASSTEVNFSGMMNVLAEVPAGDLVLLHGCCHNPSGADLTREQWQMVAQLAEEKGFTPFVDIAYQGFGEGVEEDAYGLRLLSETVPEVLFAASCSKNFGLYRERVGAVGLIAQNRRVADAAMTHMMAIVRGIYSMPPDHGAAIVAEILQSPELTAQWHTELNQMRGRIQSLRAEFARLMRQTSGTNRFDFVEFQKGMFSFLGISEREVRALAEGFGIYMLQSSRASIAGLGSNSINYVCASLAEVCQTA